jgi:REP element-mobilizing transposase RayT
MAIYRRKLPHIERDGGSYFITFHTRDDLTLNHEAKRLLLDHCLHDDGERYELDSVVVMSTHLHLILTSVRDALGYFRLATIMKGIKEHRHTAESSS